MIDPAGPFFLRSATLQDVSRIREIEHAAAQLFHTVEMREVAESPGVPAEKIAQFIEEGTALLAVNHDSQETIGFLLYRPLAGWLFVHELDIDPAWRGHRIGADLLSALQEIARKRGAEGVALTTFFNVPWNAPYYTRLGFRIWPPDQAPTLLQERLSEEKTIFPQARCLMYRSPSYILS